MKRMWSKYLLISLLTLVGVAVIIFVFGGVRGEEFSPQKFARRDFRYYQIPIFRKQIFPVTFSPNGPSPLVSHLLKNKLLGEVRAKPPRWDIVFLSEIGKNHGRGDAEILIKYLDQRGAVGTENWLDWTKNHRKISHTFWPLVAKLAHENMYVLLPDLFDAARSSSSVEQFLGHVKAELEPSIRRVADAERERTNTRRANALESLAVEISNIVAISVEEIPAESKDEGEVKASVATVAAEMDPEEMEESDP